MYTLAGNVESVQLIYEKDGLAQELIGSFKQITQKLVNKMFDEKESKSEDVAPITICLVNRGYDVLSPFIRNMTY